jgi:hypothetical protein
MSSARRKVVSVSLFESSNSLRAFLDEYPQYTDPTLGFQKASIALPARLQSHIRFALR